MTISLEDLILKLQELKAQMQIDSREIGVYLSVEEYENTNIGSVLVGWDGKSVTISQL